MKFTIYLLLLCVLLFATNAAEAQGQWVKLRKADKLYAYGKVNGSIFKYNDILAVDSSNVSANYELGRIYLVNKEDYPNAIKYLSAATENFSTKRDSIYLAYYYLAQAYKLTGEYEKAIKNFEFFQEKGVKENERGDVIRAEIANEIIECRSSDSAYRDDSFSIVRVLNIGTDVNSKLSEYCSVYFTESNQLMYTARYQDNKKERKFLDMKYFESGYSVDNQDKDKGPQLIRINSKKLDRIHFSVVSKTFKGDTVIFYKDNKLWYSTNIDGELSEPIVFPEQINRSFYQPHGVFSPDGKYFVFSSADKDIQIDLFVVEVLENGGWSEPIRLNNKINTPYKEDSPFFAEDGNILYFSSTRPGGFGRYDIYKTEMIDGDWAAPINLGAPMNSSGEDIFFNYNEDGETGFLSSNRGGGEGSMDIYLFTTKPYPTFDCDKYIEEFADAGTPKLSCLSEPYVNDMLLFDASESTFKNGDLNSVFWRVDNEILKVENTKLKYAFDVPGQHEVTAQVYGYNAEEKAYSMFCKTLTFNVLNQDQLFLEITSDRLVKENTPLAISSTILNLENTRTTEYIWYVDDILISQKGDMLSHTFQDTGKHQIRVKSIIKNDQQEIIGEIEGVREIYVFDESQEADLKDKMGEPGILLVENSDPNTGKIYALKAEVYNVPNKDRIFYDWYINDNYVEGKNSSLLAWEFQPMDVIKVVASGMSLVHEIEFTLEATKEIPKTTKPNINLDNIIDPNTGIVASMHANLFNVPKGKDIQYEWYVNGKLIQGVHSDLLKYNFKPMDVIKVIGHVMNEKGEEEFILESTELVPNVNPNLDLANKIDPTTGAIVTMHANMFNVPKGKDVQYEWYVNGKLIQGEHSDLLKYNFKPMDVIKVVGHVMNAKGEEEFVLESSETIPMETPNMDLANDIDPNTGAVVNMHANMFNIPKGKEVTYEWYVNGKLVQGVYSDLLKYNFKPMDVVRVVGKVMNAKGEEEFMLESSKTIGVDPNINLADDIDPSTGNIASMHANLFNVPKGKEVTYEWYVNGKLIQGVHSDLLKYNFKPMDVVKVVGKVKNAQGEDEFTLESTKTVPALVDLTAKLSPVYFGFDKYDLSTEAKQIIDINIAILQSNRNMKFKIEGNTDAIGASNYNVWLSRKRAKSVYNYLKENGVGDGQILGVEANGEKKPVADNRLPNGKDNPVGRQNNRRVDFSIIQ